MSTHAIVHFKTGGYQSDTILTIYRHYDGYPGGLGMDLKIILEDCPWESGYGPLIAFLTDQGAGQMNKGNVSIFPPDAEDVGEKYIYTIFLRNDEIHMRVENVFTEFGFMYGPLKLFTGSYDVGNMFLTPSEDGMTIEIPSESKEGLKYRVTCKKTWTCTCPDFVFRKHKCKHIKGIEWEM